jgi:hypothetical protein
MALGTRMEKGPDLFAENFRTHKTKLTFVNGNFILKTR